MKNFIMLERGEILHDKHHLITNTIIETFSRFEISKLVQAILKFKNIVHVLTKWVSQGKF